MAARSHKRRRVGSSPFSLSPRPSSQSFPLTARQICEIVANCLNWHSRSLPVLFRDTFSTARFPRRLKFLETITAAGTYTLSGPRRSLSFSLPIFLSFQQVETLQKICFRLTVSESDVGGVQLEKIREISKSALVKVVVKFLQGRGERTLQSQRSNPDSPLFLRMCRVVVPPEIVVRLLQFLQFDSALLMGFGMVCWNSYRIVLNCWPRLVVTPHNLRKIPRSVLSSVREFEIRGSAQLTVSEWKYLVRSSEEFVHVEDLWLVDGISSHFFTALHRVGVTVFHRLRRLQVGTNTPDDFASRLITMAPNLEE